VSKRTQGLERRKHDAYLTPYHGAVPLLAHLEPKTHFLEPCAGDGRLIGYLQEHGHICEGAWDIAPQDQCIRELDALYLVTGLPRAKVKFITNPPWTRALLHPLIVHLAGQHDTWLLFDADWAHTVQAAPYLPFCERIVSAGRIRWLEDDPADRGFSPKDNCAWYLFTDKRGPGPVFCGRD
jgi:hypothetical protein